MACRYYNGQNIILRVLKESSSKWLERTLTLNAFMTFIRISTLQLPAVAMSLLNNSEALSISHSSRSIAAKQLPVVLKIGWKSEENIFLL